MIEKDGLDRIDSIGVSLYTFRRISNLHAARSETAKYLGTSDRRRYLGQLDKSRLPMPLELT
jgi:hypothetical protein